MNRYSYKIMQNNEIKKITNFFKTISDPTRFKILLLLKENKTLCVSEIVKAMKMEQSAISHQLVYLKRLNFVKSNKQSKTVYYSLSCNHISELINNAREHINKHNCK